MLELNQLIHDVMGRAPFVLPNQPGYFYELDQRELEAIQAGQGLGFCPLPPCPGASPCLHVVPAELTTAGSSAVAQVREWVVVHRSELLGD